MNPKPSWSWGAVLLLAGMALFGLGIGAADLFNPDEPREAEIAREMLEGGDFVAPRLNGEPFLEKPPLFYWLVVGACRIAGGPSEAAARLVPAIAGLLCVLIVFAAGRRMIGGEGALVAAAVLLTAFEFLWLSRRCLIDMPLTLAVLLACLCLHRGIVVDGARRGAWLAAGYTATAAAVLFKGIIGAGIPALAVLGFLAAGGGWRGLGRRIRRAWIVPGFLLALAPTAGWTWLLWRRLGDDAAREFVWVNNVLRFVGGAEGKGHEQPFYYYLPTLILEFLPWSLLLPPAIAAAWIAARRGGRDAVPGGPGDAADDETRATLRYLLAWFSVPIVVLSIASTKRGIYLLPIYPAAALLVGWSLARGAGRLVLGLLVACSLLIAAGAVVAQSLLPWRPAITVPFVLLVLLLTTLALRALQDRRAVRCALLCAVMAGAAWMVVVLHVVPEIVERAASSRPVAAAVRRHVDEGDRLAFFDFPQGQLGGILYYARLTLPNLRTPSEMDRFLAGDGPAGSVPGSAAGTGDGRTFVLVREVDHATLAPRLTVPTVVARRFETAIRDPRGRPGQVILLLARAGMEDNATGTTRRTPP